MTIRLMIADDHQIVREGLKQLLQGESGFLVAAEAWDGAEVMRQVRDQPFDLVIMDMTMPGISGIELIKQIKSEKPKLPVLVLSMHKEEQYAVRSLKAGAAGYLTKDTASSQLIEAIRKVTAGGLYISSGVAERLAMELGSKPASIPHELLSDREYQVFSMLIKGDTVTHIASELSVSAKTISTHKTRILQKMNMSSTAELVSYAVHNELMP
jgi:two-component system, NarL family, invasion response regulator UvrY